MEDPPKKFFRLAPGREVRLRAAYFLTCTSVVKDESGRIEELRCTYDPASKGGNSPDGRKVKATLHWVSALHAIPAEIRLYNQLFRLENPMKLDDPFSGINPDSLEIRRGWLEPSLASAKAGDRLQFERVGYFCVDPDSRPGSLVINRTSTLKDEWANIQKREA
jgi:glutaminyl-tRNA synthetase